MNRRDLIKSAVLGAGAASVAGAQQPSHVHVKTILPAQAASSAAWTPAVLDPHQNETVVQLSELIIPATDTPGARAAKVNEWIDLYLSDIAEDKGHSFLQGLGWLDGYALKKHNQPFVALAATEQTGILKELEAAGHDDAELSPGAVFFDSVKRDGVPSTYACPSDTPI